MAWLQAGRPRNRGSTSDRSKRSFSSTQRPTNTRVTQPPIQWASGTLFPMEEGSGQNEELTTHLTQCQAKVSAELYLDAPDDFKVWCLINHGDNFTLYMFISSRTIRVTYCI